MVLAFPNFVNFNQFGEKSILRKFLFDTCKEIFSNSFAKIDK